ncbi:alpha/beta-hydrolase [Penicillium cosmopolitanum]|uniref:Alpha/beta-hydrolase n=1 Tax=Penicillium cosmopolitanum TaxID=1131564 RepID=A0A9X0BET4_9EURO|nr:alpha/beta-hydrolase [Penicillium cosmopolitanum]KAJ5414485.1 alpha/beta-hydrolase [Penicillium cosmopolitanum]
MQRFKSFTKQINRRSTTDTVENCEILPDSSMQPGTTTVIAQDKPSESSFPDGVEILYNAPQAELDICFLHGLTGDRRKTWTPHGQEEPWPKTLLPAFISKARILTYGYDAYALRKSVASNNRVIDHATNLLHDLTTDRASCNASSRPIIFVAHSLGGLVCKKALLLSRNNPESHLQEIFDSTKGVIFMGTPHDGSRMANWTKIPAAALGFVKSSNKSLLDVLETKNQLLESLQIEFLEMVRNLQGSGRSFEVTCFFEELPLSTFGKVVPKESAVLYGYNSISIHANHSEMVKFESSEATGFKRLLGELQRWSSQLRYGAKKFYRPSACFLIIKCSTTNLSPSSNSSSLPEEDISKFTFRNSGEGTMNVNSGPGTQNSNSGAGYQFNGTVNGLSLS